MAAALKRHGAEAELALAELAANPALPRLAALLGPENLGRLLAEAPLDLSAALAELAPMLPELEAIHALSLRPDMIGKNLARSLPSVMKGLREVCLRREMSRPRREFEALLPEAARRAVPKPFPEANSEAGTLLALLEGLAGRPAPPPKPGGLPTGCEVEVPHLTSYLAGGAYLFALWAGIPLGEDELIEFSLPPSPGGEVQVRLVGALIALGLLPPGQALSLHITCETPEEAAASEEMAEGMRLVSFCLAFLYSADRRLAAGQIFKNFRLKRRGIRGLKWPRAVGAEYRLANVCTAKHEPGVAGESERAHQAQIALAARLHAALIAHCVSKGGTWGHFRAGLTGWLEGRGLAELAGREHNVTGELATLYVGRRTPALQEELLALIRDSFGS